MYALIIHPPQQVIFHDLDSHGYFTPLYWFLYTILLFKFCEEVLDVQIISFRRINV